jgi:DNA-directed RNA polymerase omega subunit
MSDETEEPSDSDFPKELDSKYRLILLAAQRSKQLKRGAVPKIHIDPAKHKPTRIALEEVIRGKVNFVRNDQSSVPPQRLVPNQEYVALALIGDRIKLVALSPDGQYTFLDESNGLHNFIHVSAFEVSALHEAIEELESLVNNPKSKEHDFQNFFARNKDFILNDEYKDAHPHVVLTSDKGKPLIPDFVLEPVIGELCDLLELKLPSTQIFNLKKNRMRYSAAVAEAAAQLRLYGRYFEEEKNRKDILERYGLRAYKPKMLVIIGRRYTEIDPLDERSMQTDLPNLHLRTYDDIISRMKWRAEKLKGRHDMRLR